MDHVIAQRGEQRLRRGRGPGGGDRELELFALLVAIGRALDGPLPAQNRFDAAVGMAIAPDPQDFVPRGELAGAIEPAIAHPAVEAHVRARLGASGAQGVRVGNDGLELELVSHGRSGRSSSARHSPRIASSTASVSLRSAKTA